MNRTRILSLALLVPLCAAVFLVGTDAPAREAPKRNKLAVLIASYKPGQKAMQEDLSAAYRALVRRGYQPGEILVLEGPITRGGVLAFLGDVSRRVASWRDGEVFLFYSGCGMYRFSGQRDPRPGMDLAGESVLWDEVFETLALPRSIHLTLLADCCHNNLLAGRVPANVTTLVQKAPGDELVCQAKEYAFLVNGVKVPRGVLSYYAVLALEKAATTEDWLRMTLALCRADLASGVLPPQLGLSLTLTGAPGQPFGGVPVK